jgi:hypothetical protein
VPGVGVGVGGGVFVGSGVIVGGGVGVTGGGVFVFVGVGVLASIDEAAMALPIQIATQIRQLAFADIGTLLERVTRSVPMFLAEAGLLVPLQETIRSYVAASAQRN